MTTMTRRTFLEQAGMGAIALSGAIPLRAEQEREIFFEALGVCTSVKNAPAMKARGAEYIEEGVRRFLVPDKPDDVFEKNLQAARAMPLSTPACNGFLPGSLKSVGPSADHPAVLTFADTAFKRARRAGVEAIVFGSSGSRRRPEGFPVAKAEKQFIDLLKGMGPLAEAQGVTVVVEPLRYKEVNFINTVAEGARIVEQVNHPGVRLLSDLYHMKCNGETPEDLARVVPLLRHAHIAEKEGRTAPGVHGDDFKPFFRVLRDGGYRGRISIEGSWNDTTLARGFEVIREQAAI